MGPTSFPSPHGPSSACSTKSRRGGSADAAAAVPLGRRRRPGVPLASRLVLSLKCTAGRPRAPRGPGRDPASAPGASLPAGRDYHGRLRPTAWVRVASAPDPGRRRNPPPTGPGARRTERTEWTTAGARPRGRARPKAAGARSTNEACAHVSLTVAQTTGAGRRRAGAGAVSGGQDRAGAGGRSVPPELASEPGTPPAYLENENGDFEGPRENTLAEMFVKGPVKAQRGRGFLQSKDGRRKVEWGRFLFQP